jgi:hypothetical protein
MPVLTVETDARIKEVLRAFWNDRLGFVKAVFKVTPTPQQAEALIALDNNDNVTIRSGHGCGKAQPLSLEIDTPRGKVKFGDLKPGDFVFGIDGKPTKIISVHERGMLPVFRISFDDGSSTVACEDHLWSVYKKRQKGNSENEKTIFTTRQLIESGIKKKNGAGETRIFALPQHSAVEYPFRWVPVEPYALGVWLGDGGRKTSVFTSADIEIANSISESGSPIKSGGVKKDNKASTYNISGIQRGLRDLGIFECYSYEKKIPPIYKFNIAPIRLAVLQGLMDTDGYASNKIIRSPMYSTTSKQLADDVAWIVRSLGGKARVGKPQKKNYRRKTGEKAQGRDCYTVTINFHDGTLPFRLPRKNSRLRDLAQRYTHRWIDSIVSEGKEYCRCITVEAHDGLYLSNDFIVTHNSTVMAWAAWHYLCCRPHCRVPCTAPTKHQLYDILWSEMMKWHRKMNPIFRDQFETTKERIEHVDDPTGWYAVARTATKENPDALQGFHAEYVLRIIEEASGVPDESYEVLLGAHGMKETKELMGGNPTRIEGSFFRSHNQDKELYKALGWSCLDSPICPPTFPTRIERKYGKDSNIYRVRVLGLFPERDGDTFIPYDLAATALDRDILPQTGFDYVLGVDVARFGDDKTVIATRRGDEFLPYHEFSKKDTMETSGYVAKMANELKPRAIFVDVIGVGAGVYDRLKELGYPVIAVNVSEAPATNPQQYRRLRDELWGNFRDWLELRRGKLWDNDLNDLVGQLTTPKYSLTSDGKIIVESKDDMKKRGHESPNVADAHIMTFLQPTYSYAKEDPDNMEQDEQEERPFDPEAGY